MEGEEPGELSLARRRQEDAIDFRNLLLSPKGRIKRKQFWVATAILTAAIIPGLFLPWVLEELIYLLVCYPSVCVNAKRLHDLGHSGWLQLVAWIPSVPLMLAGWAVAAKSVSSGPAAAQMLEDQQFASPAGMALMWGYTAINLAFLIYTGAAKGQDHANRYGPSPGAAPIEDIF